jgi:hypothetical protein
MSLAHRQAVAVLAWKKLYKTGGLLIDFGAKNKRTIPTVGYFIIRGLGNPQFERVL